MSHGYRKVDKALANKQGELLTRDGSGNIWLMKRWFAGRECDLKDAKQVCRAMSHLAMLHLWMSEQQIFVHSKLKMRRNWHLAAGKRILAGRNCRRRK